MLQTSKFICNMGTVQIIWQNEERSKFQQHHCRNSKKKKYEREEKGCDGGKERKLNFGNYITEIHAQIPKLPR